ncbi:LysR family transcriptional regulator substrate-binding protein [Streptomyces sp. NPDC047130]|uniref:LysR family transcriptional regulator substrate-binding protein n=1 Tax=Streptomyces sp. NPDC047130 TaxID=3155261 RepID=UPI0033E019C8
MAAVVGGAATVRLVGLECRPGRRWGGCGSGAFAVSGREGWWVGELFVEERGVLLPARHRLADSETVEFRELWEKPFVASGAGRGVWRDDWLAVEERDGDPIWVGAVTSCPEDRLGAVADGCVALVPVSAARFYARPDVVFRPVRGLSPSRVALARPRGRTHEAALDELLEAIAQRLSRI